MERRRDIAAIAILLIVYAIVRVLSIPADPLLSNGSGHDGAYLAMVARNLLAGKGFVLDALWLVFLQPDRLPMPYHNANPLYPIAMAGVAKLTGMDVVRAGFLVSALSSAGVILAMTAILTQFGNSLRRAFVIASIVAVSPVIWDMSWCNITDEFSLMFLLASFAAILRSERPYFAAVAGLLYGLAWLARSMAILAVPTLVAWMWVRFGWRKAILRTAVFGAVAGVVSMPWLLHNWQVWGNAFRSDNGYLTSIVGYYGYRLGGAVRAWHSPEVPASIGQLIGQHPSEIAHNWLRGLIPLVKNLVTALTGASYLKLAILLVLTVGLLVRNRRLLVSGEAAAFGLYFAGAAATISIGGILVEPRYVLPGYALFAAWLFTSAARLLDDRKKRVLGRTEKACLAMAALYLTCGILPSTMARASGLRRPDLQEKVPMMAAATAVNRTISHGSPVVVGNYPYLYSIFTGAQALAIPQSDDSYLLSYMRKYRACCVLLNAAERDFWRPSWRMGPPPGLVLLRAMDGYYVYGLDLPPNVR